MNRPAPSYASSYKPRGSYVSQGQRRPPVTTPITAAKGSSIPPIRPNPDPNQNTLNSTQGKATRPQKSILQTVPIRADISRGRERSYLSPTLTTRNKLKPKSPHLKAKSPESRPTPPKQTLLPWDKEVPLGSTVPGPLLVSLPPSGGPEVPDAEVEQVQYEMNQVPMIEDQEEFDEKGIIEEEVYLLSEELLALVPNETSAPQANPEIEQLEIPVPAVRECLTQDLTAAPEFDDEQPLHSVKPDMSNFADDQVDGVLYFSSKYSTEPQIEIATLVVSDEEVVEKSQLEYKTEVSTHPEDAVQVHNANNNDVQQFYPVDINHIAVIENSEVEQSDYEVEPEDAGGQIEEMKGTDQDPKMETQKEPVLSEEDSNRNSAPSNKCHTESKAPTRKPEVKNPRELKFAEEQSGNGTKRHSYRSKSVDRNNTSRYSQMAQNRNGRGLKLSEQYPSNGPPAVHPSTSKEAPRKNTQKEENKPKPREASRSRLKSDLKPRQRVDARKNNAVDNNQLDPEGPTGDVKCTHTVLLHDLGKAVVGTLRFRNVADEPILFRVTTVKDDIPFSIEPKEGQLGSGKSVVIKLQCNSVSKFARVAEQAFKIETIKVSVKNALNLSVRNWMHCKSTKAVFTTSNLMLNNTSSILRHYASNLDNERFQPIKPPERQHSVNVHSLLLDIQKGQAENLRIHWYQKMHFLFAAVLACVGCFWLSPIEPASFSRMISN